VKRYDKPSFEVRVQRINETPGSFLLDTPVAADCYWREKVAAMPWHDAEREMCVAVAVNTRFAPIGHSLVSVGTVNESLVHPRDVFRYAVAIGAYGVLVMHNHPSGDPSPSAADRVLTKRLGESGQLLSVRLIDHVIVGAGSHYSFREAGLV
jgi:DNA repair protein RadC